MALAQLLERDRHKYADAEYRFLQVCVRDLDNRISVKSPAAQKAMMVQFLKDLQQAAYRYQGQPIPLASLQQNPRRQRGFRQPYVHSYYVPPQPQPPLFQNWTRPAGHPHAFSSWHHQTAGHPQQYYQPFHHQHHVPMAFPSYAATYQAWVQQHHTHNQQLPAHMPGQGSHFPGHGPPQGNSVPPRPQNSSVQMATQVGGALTMAVVANILAGLLQGLLGLG